MSEENFSPEISEKEVEQEQFEVERALRAEERNKYRTVWQRLFGREKATAMDLAMDEAMEMDAAIEKEIKEGRAETFEEALKIVNQFPEFQIKGPEQIKKEEYARAKTLQFGKALIENSFSKAQYILTEEQYKKGVDEETRKLIDERATALVKEKVTSLAHTKDGKNFVNAVYWFDKRLDRADLPAEDVTSKEISEAVRKHAISWFNTFSTLEPENVSKEFDKFSRLGLVDKKEMLQAPEIKQIAHDDIISWFRTFSHDPETFLSVRDNLVKLGVGSAEEFNKLPEIQEFARKEAIMWFNCWGFTHNTVEHWTNFENMGILSREQISQIPQIREIAKEQIRVAVEYSSYEDFKKKRDQGVALGLIDRKEVDSMPEVKERRGI